ncbi:MAG: DMT family transporter [Rhodoluna sp.]
MFTKQGSRVDVLLLTVAVFWGSSYYFAKQLTAHASVPGMLAIRFSVASVIMLGIWFFRRSKFTKADLVGGAITGVSLFVIMIIETTSISLTSATNAGLIISLTIILTPIFESMWSRSWLPRKFFIAAFGSVIGVAFLVSANGFVNPNIGDIIMLAAATLRAATTVAQGHIMKAKSAGTYNVTIVQIAVAALLFVCVDPAGTFNAATTFELAQWGDVMFLVLFCTVFGFVALLWGIRKTSSSRASLLLSTEPVWAVIVPLVIGGEVMGWLGFVGAALIIGSCYWGLGIEARHRAATA